MRVILAALVLALFLLSGSPVFAQSPNGSITGMVLDPDGKTIPGAEIIVVNDVTRIKYVSSTNGEGIYTVANLPPGPYRIQVSKVGFKAIIKPDIILNVQDALSINFNLPIGASSVVVTVEGGAPMINTQSAAVSTVVDRNFVENTPLNGRSFQDLILLTPGTVTNGPQTPSSPGSSGEFSVNGQRTESNYYSVDGVSANVGTSIGVMYLTATTGSLPASTALGTTQALVSVDALAEFRVQSSTYSAEYGRNPGGQFSFLTRSGSNQWHGTAFDYLRNNVFDANDWFNGHFDLPQAALRQNDFGGVLGGPVEIPRRYSGKDKTFFFFSYEGLRLLQPQPASISDVPTSALRQSAAAVLQPVLNAFPVPNCPLASAKANCTNDLGNGFGQFVGTWSNPSSIDSYGIRLDQLLGARERLFFRFSDTKSSVGGRIGGNFGSPSVNSTTDYVSRTYTAGLASAFSAQWGNDLRFNYSSNEGTSVDAPTEFGGATAVNLFALQGLAPSSIAAVQVVFPVAGTAGNVPELTQAGNRGQQQQWNIVDGASVSLGRHQMKFGIDYRKLNPSGVNFNPYLNYQFRNQNAIDTGAVNFTIGRTFRGAHATFQNFSSYAQDEWRVKSNLTISAGLRWDINPAPSASTGELPYTVQGTSLATLTLAPEGTAIWQTGWHNFAPRVGIAYIIRSKPGWETVVRGGGGVFFDTGQQNGAVGYNGVGFSATKVSFGGVVFPAPVSQVAPQVVNPPITPYGLVYAFPSHLQLPYTWQTNVTVQQALGQSQALSIAYVGGFGRKLLESQQEFIGPVNPNFGVLFVTKNGLTSDYNSLQIQFQRRLTRGLQVLASYTLSHCLDYGSQDLALPYQRGSCDFDVRHNFSGALSYEVPNAFHGGVARAVLSHWAIDDRLTARTAFPVTLAGDQLIDPVTLQASNAGLDLVPGQPLYIHGAQCSALYSQGGIGGGCPGGWAINPNAFTLPASPSGVGNAGRDIVRGFGAVQMDFAVRREFPLRERLKLQFRAEAFNTFNHPNFGTINSVYCSPVPTSASFQPGCNFGQATATLAQSLGILSPLYQSGGPRSMQFALKLSF